MKAEHRKELETNALADRMGRVLENFKQKPQRGTVMWVFLGLFILIAVYVSVRWYRLGRDENSEGWYNSYVYFNLREEGQRQQAHQYAQAIIETHAEKFQGKAVRFEFAWESYWSGLRRMGIDAKGAETDLNRAKDLYEQLRKDCEGDKVLVPEAIYGLALIEETLAIKNRENLTTAIEHYEDLAKNHAKSADGELATKRLDFLNSDAGRKEVGDLYQELATFIRMDRPAPGLLDRPLGGLLDPKK